MAVRLEDGPRPGSPHHENRPRVARQRSGGGSLRAPAAPRRERRSVRGKRNCRQTVAAVTDGGAPASVASRPAPRAGSCPVNQAQHRSPATSGEQECHNVQAPAPARGTSPVPSRGKHASLHKPCPSPSTQDRRAQERPLTSPVKSRIGAKAPTVPQFHEPAVRRARQPPDHGTNHRNPPPRRAARMAPPARQKPIGPVEGHWREAVSATTASSSQPSSAPEPASRPTASFAHRHARVSLPLPRPHAERNKASHRQPRAESQDTGYRPAAHQRLAADPAILSEGLLVQAAIANGHQRSEGMP